MTIVDRDPVHVLKAEVERLRNALTAIRDSEHCQYGRADPYSIGVTDGHRLCSSMARAALDDRVVFIDEKSGPITEVDIAMTDPHRS